MLPRFSLYINSVLCDNTEQFLDIVDNLEEEVNIEVKTSYADYQLNERLFSVDEDLVASLLMNKGIKGLVSKVSELDFQRLIGEFLVLGSEINTNPKSHKVVPIDGKFMLASTLPKTEDVNGETVTMFNLMFVFKMENVGYADLYFKVEKWLDILAEENAIREQD